MSRNPISALLAIMTIPHAKGSLRTGAPELSHSSPASQTMLRPRMTLLCRCILLQFLSCTLNIHLHLSQALHDHTRAGLSLTNRAWKSSTSSEPLNYSLIIRKVAIMMNRGFFGADVRCKGAVDRCRYSARDARRRIGVEGAWRKVERI